MSLFGEQLEALREHNRALLRRLKQEQEAFTRAAVSTPGVTPADTISEHKVSALCLTTEQKQGSSKWSPQSDFTTDVHCSPPQEDNQTRGLTLTETSHHKDTRRVAPGVSFSERTHHLPPLLGYDWIAGVLDVKDSVIERSDEFFNDLCSFRSLNKNECVHSSQRGCCENPLGLSVLRDEGDPKANVDTHQCTFSYKMNSRLFPVPLHTECCPVCKRHKSSHPHTLGDPALIRVSIPRSTILPPYKHRPHRRCSFNPSDSLGLTSHCLAGWSNKGQKPLPVPSSLDLRSSVNEKEGFSIRQASTHQMSDASRLAPHNSQRSPKKSRQHL